MVKPHNVINYDGEYDIDNVGCDFCSQLLQHMLHVYVYKAVHECIPSFTLHVCVYKAVHKCIPSFTLHVCVCKAVHKCIPCFTACLCEQSCT